MDLHDRHLVEDCGGAGQHHDLGPPDAPCLCVSKHWNPQIFITGSIRLYTSGLQDCLQELIDFHNLEHFKLGSAPDMKPTFWGQIFSILFWLSANQFRIFVHSANGRHGVISLNIVFAHLGVFSGNGCDIFYLVGCALGKLRDVIQGYPGSSLLKNHAM